MPFTLRGWRLQAAGHVGALASIVALFAFIGPFGTYDSMSASGRIGYWAVAMGGNWGIWMGSVLLALHLAQDWQRRRRALALASAMTLAAVPGTLIVFAVETLFRPGNIGMDSLPEIYIGVTAIGLVISVVALAVHSRPTQQVQEVQEAQETPPAPPRFLDRLPHEIGRDLIYLKMADHYVEAFTTAGSDLVLMRFADAIAELEGADGMRVHRSYWVTRAHVTGAERARGRPTLQLTGGHKVPVSRTYLPEARAAGLI